MSKVVVFDVDGTLFDTKSGIIKALNEVLHNFGMESINPVDEDKWIGPPVRKSFITFSNMNEEQAEAATKQYRQIYTEKYISESVLYDGMSEVLNTLRSEKCHLCIATMKTQEQVERLLTLNDMSDVFEIVHTALANGKKTKTDMLEFIREVYPNNSNYFMVGDTIGDLESAMNMKYEFIGAAYGYGKISRDSCSSVIMFPKDILEVIL